MARVPPKVARIPGKIYFECSAWVGAAGGVDAHLDSQVRPCVDLHRCALCRGEHRGKQLACAQHGTCAWLTCWILVRKRDLSVTRLESMPHARSYPLLGDKTTLRACRDPRTHRQRRQSFPLFVSAAGPVL